MLIALAAMIIGCSTDDGNGKNHDSDNATASRGEHDRDGGEHGREGRGEHDRSGEGEESGTELALNATYNKVRNGARLILAYDAKTNAFTGTVERAVANTAGNTVRETPDQNCNHRIPTVRRPVDPRRKTGPQN